MEYSDETFAVTKAANEAFYIECHRSVYKVKASLNEKRPKLV